MVINSLIFPYDNRTQIRFTMESLDRELLAFLEEMFDGDDVRPNPEGAARKIEDMDKQLKIFAGQKLYMRPSKQKRELNTYREYEDKARKLVAHMEVLRDMEHLGRLNEESRRRLKKCGANIRDRRAPVVTTRHVYYAKGVDTPDALDFIHTISEADEYKAYFEGKVPDLTQIGDYDIVFRVEDASGNKTEELHSILTVVEDTEAPVFATVPELSAFVGEAIAYRKGLVVTDNCGGEVEVQVDSTAVDPNTPGDYPVSFTATDASGNTAWATTTIHIYENQITEEQLAAQIDGVIAQIITPGMSKEEQLRAVYTYVYDHIAYTSDSDKSDWIRAAYDGLFVTGSGDCYNYFAAAIAFCRRLGIDYREIERTPGAADGTHFWIMVNIGDDEKPRWYHFDCTHLRATYSHSGCLLTDGQLRAFNKFRAGFYAYDAASYPASEKIIITPTPDLEKYY
jgi:hypothetical protein